MNTLRFLIILAAFIVSASIHLPAQTVANIQKMSIDTDIRTARNNAIPDFHYKYDDYIQYAPAVIMLGVKAGLKRHGYEGRSSWGRMIVADAFSAAIMTGAINGLKYSVRRMRPDETSRNSFPSGHTATAFMTATMLHKEYGWEKPWLSIGGYSIAALVGVSRIMNNRHWMSDVTAGAAIGIGSVHLGYFLSDLIFKGKHISDGYEKPDMFAYDPEHKYYEAGLFFARRYILGWKSEKQDNVLPQRGSSAGVEVNIPLIPRTGIAFRTSVNPMIFGGGSSVIMYNAHIGGFWVYPFPKLVEFNLKAMLGYAWHRLGNGIDAIAEISVALRAGENFRIKALAEYETFSFSQQKPFLNSFLIGYSASWCW